MRGRQTLGRAQSLETLKPAPGDTPKRAFKIKRLQKWSGGKDLGCQPTEAFNKPSRSSECLFIFHNTAEVTAFTWGKDGSYSGEAAWELGRGSVRKVMTEYWRGIV